MKICGINGCEVSHSRLLPRGQFVRTNNEEDGKKKEAYPSQKGNKRRVMRDLIQRQSMLQNKQK